MSSLRSQPFFGRGKPRPQLTESQRGLNLLAKAEKQEQERAVGKE